MNLENIYDPEELEYEELEQQEINEEQVADTQEPELEEPEKFKGVDRSKIIKSYLELEKVNGRHAQELGELRKMADQYLRQELERVTKAKEPEPEPEITLDDMIAQPVKAIGKAVEPKIRNIEDRLNQYEKQLALREFQKKHPDIQDIGADPEFIEWVQGSTYRTRQFIAADQHLDLEAADELLSTWKERKEMLASKKEEQKEKMLQNRDRDLKNLTLESGSTGEVSKKVYRRADLINLRNSDPDRFDAMYEEISKAYLEGRVK